MLFKPESSSIDSGNFSKVLLAKLPTLNVALGWLLSESSKMSRRISPSRVPCESHDVITKQKTTSIQLKCWGSFNATIKRSSREQMLFMKFMLLWANFCNSPLGALHKWQIQTQVICLNYGTHTVFLLLLLLTTTFPFVLRSKQNDDRWELNFWFSSNFHPIHSSHTKLWSSFRLDKIDYRQC